MKPIKIEQHQTGQCFTLPNFTPKPVFATGLAIIVFGVFYTLGATSLLFGPLVILIGTFLTFNGQSIEILITDDEVKVYSRYLFMKKYQNILRQDCQKMLIDYQSTVVPIAQWKTLFDFEALIIKNGKKFITIAAGYPLIIQQNLAALINREIGLKIDHQASVLPANNNGELEKLPFYVNQQQVRFYQSEDMFILKICAIGFLNGFFKNLNIWIGFILLLIFQLMLWTPANGQEKGYVVIIIFNLLSLFMIAIGINQIQQRALLTINKKWLTIDASSPKSKQTLQCSTAKIEQAIYLEIKRKVISNNDRERTSIRKIAQIISKKGEIMAEIMNGYPAIYKKWIVIAINWQLDMRR